MTRFSSSCVVVVEKGERKKKKLVSCSCCSRPSCFTRRVFSLIESLVQLLSSASLSRTHSDSAEFSFQVVVHPNSWWPFLARIIERRPKLKELLLLNDGCVSDYCGQNGRRHHHGRSNWKLDVVNVEKSAMGVSALHWPQNRLVHPFSEKKNSRYDRGNKTRKKKEDYWNPENKACLLFFYSSRHVSRHAFRSLVYGSKKRRRKSLVSPVVSNEINRENLSFIQLWTLFIRSFASK